MRRSWLAAVLFAVALAIQALTPAVASVVIAAAPIGEASQTTICFDGRNKIDSDCVSCSGVSSLEAGRNILGKAPVRQAIALTPTVADRALPACAI